MTDEPLTKAPEGPEPLKGELIRNKEGQFVKGTSGNPLGRPKGSKNRVTMLKIAAEEAWRERNHEALQGVLDLVLADALEGDKSARKLIFDALISKANVSEDKAAGQKQTITVHRMDVRQDKSTAEENNHE
jgi:hypothetical protein